MKHSIEAYKNRLEAASVGIAEQFYFGYREDVNRILDKDRYPVIIAEWPQWPLTKDDHITIRQTLFIGTKSTSEIRAVDELQDVATNYIDAITSGQYEVIDRNNEKVVSISPKGITADTSTWLRFEIKIRMFCDASPVATVSGYGFLYNGYAIDSRSFAPTGWQVMTANEWDELETNLPSGARAAALKAFDQSKWADENEYIYKADLWDKFKALPGGIRNSDGSFEYRGEAANIARFIGENVGAIFIGLGADTGVVAGDKNTGFSVRMVYTGAGNPGAYMTDPDGNKYNIVQIGTKYYIDADYRSTKDINGDPIEQIQDAADWAAAVGAAYCEYE